MSLVKNAASVGGIVIALRPKLILLLIPKFRLHPPTWLNRNDDPSAQNHSRSVRELLTLLAAAFTREGGGVRKYRPMLPPRYRRFPRVVEADRRK